MNDREKLIKLLRKDPCKSDCENSGGACPYRKYGDCTMIDKIDMCALNKLTDHLIANGVTVQRRNPAPLTLDELRQMKDEPVYLELFNPLLISGWHIIKAVTSDKIIYRDWQHVYTPINGLGVDYNLYRYKPKERN